jgi:Tfp pilus assembly protein PilX
MNIKKTRKFRVSNQSLALIITLVTLLVVSIFWNLHQQRLIKQEHLQAVAVQRAEAARVSEQAVQDEARAKRNAAWAASDARVQQLYREINSLSQINEQLLAPTDQQRITPAKKDDSVEPAGSP